MIFLAALGGLAAHTGGASVVRGAARVNFWGAFTMAVTRRCECCLRNHLLRTESNCAAESPENATRKTMNKISPCSFFALVFCCIATSVLTQAQTRQTKNIIFVMTDGLRW